MLGMIIGDLLLLGTSSYVLKNGQFDPWTTATLCFLCSHALLGVANKIDQNNDVVNKLISISRSMVQLVPLAFMNTAFYLKGGFRPEVVYLHSFAALAPLFMEIILRERDNSNVKDLICIGNIVSCAFLALQDDKNSQYASLAIIATINRYFLGSLNDALNLPPSQGLSTGLALFAWCIQLTA